MQGHYDILLNTSIIWYDPYKTGGRRGRDPMVVGFTFTYAIGAYHH